MGKLVESTELIPTTLAEITPAWLSDLISRDHPDIEVISAEVGDYFGHKQNKARVKVEYNEAGRKVGLPQALVVKGAFKVREGGNEPSGMDLGLELELLSYAKLVPFLDRPNTPHCFGVCFDAKNRNGAMVLEDLAPSGATFLHQVSSLGYAQVAGFLDAWARIHAQWLDSPELEPGGRFGPDSSLVQCGDRLQRDYIDHLVRPEYWDTFVALPRGAALHCLVYCRMPTAWLRHRRA